MKKPLTFLACGLFCCALATLPAHAADATGSITKNTMVPNYATQTVNLTVEFSATNNTPNSGTLDLNDQWYHPGVPNNYYFLQADPQYTIASSQTYGSYDKGPWKMTGSYFLFPGGNTVYRNDCVLTATLGFPSYKVQLDTNTDTETF